MFDIGHYAQNPEPAAYLVTVSLGTFVSVLDGSGRDLLAASSPNLAVSVEEGGAITAYVKLNRKPKSEVRISFASSGLLELDVFNSSSVAYRGGLKNYSAPPVLIFDSSNWNVPQTFSVQSIEDGTADGTRTLPVRMSISTGGRATGTNAIWVRSLDSGTVSTTGSQPFKSTGTIERIREGGLDNGLTRLSDATALASYDGTKGTAKFLVNSIKLNIRNLVIEVDYTINSQNKVIVDQVRGFSRRDLSLDLNYVPLDTYYGSFGLSGVMTIRQPEHGRKDIFFVTSTARNSCDLNQYAGTWYEQGSAKRTVSTKLLNATYTYLPRPDGSLDVEYAGNYGSTNGTIQTAIGVATPVRDLYSDSSNTYFNIFYSSWSTSRPPSSDYRIIDFAPDYSWAIASDRFGGNGVILTRDQIIGDETYQAILDRAAWLGVKTNKFTRTVQTAPP
jgi:apolipoprotein D and lipocalin family protein